MPAIYFWPLAFTAQLYALEIVRNHGNAGLCEQFASFRKIRTSLSGTAERINILTS